MIGRIILSLLLLLLHTAASATNEQTFVTYHEREYKQGPLKAYAVIEKQGRKMLMPQLHNELFGNESGILDRIFELLAEDKPDVYKNSRLRLPQKQAEQSILWDTLIVRLDNVSDDEFSTIRNEVVYSFGVHGENNFVKFFFKDGRSEVYSIEDIEIPVFKLWLPKEESETDTLLQVDTLQQDSTTLKADRQATMEEDIENWRTWFFIALGACIFMLIVIIILTLRLR